MKAIFWNTGERRLRAGWRIALQFALFIGVALAQALPAILVRNQLTTLLAATLYLTLGLGMAWLMARFIDRRPFLDYGFHLSAAWWLDFGFGLVLGAVLITGVFVVELREGWVTIKEGAASPGLDLGLVVLLSVLVYIAIGFNEEFTFRGYQLRNLAEGLIGRHISPVRAVMLAAFLTSAAFGALHLLNKNATWLGGANIFGAGLLLSLPYVATGELAISIGLHITWNLFEGTVYDFPVSGGAPTRHLISIDQGGPELWTGGPFGPEGGLLSIIWMLVGCGVIVLWLRVRRHPLIQGRLACYEPPSSLAPAIPDSPAPVA